MDVQGSKVVTYSYVLDGEVRFLSFSLFRIFVIEKLCKRIPINLTEVNQFIQNRRKGFVSSVQLLIEQNRNSFVFMSHFHIGTLYL